MPPPEHPLPGPNPKPKPPKPKPPKPRPEPLRDHVAVPEVPFPPDHFACASRCTDRCAHHGLCAPLPPPAATVHLRSSSSSRLPTPLIALSASVLAASALLLVILLVCHLLRRRRQRQSAAAPLTQHLGNAEAGTAPPLALSEGEEGDGGVHHVWYIRTVGLDERAIAAITALVYDSGKCRRVGQQLLGGDDDGCAVCLAEFRDGETLRLLPRCGHAFHRGCIDVWLRAHVNCPLCRSDVLDPAAAAATGVAVQSNSDQSTADPDVNANAAAEQVDAASDSTLEHEDEELENAPHLQEDQQEQQFSTPEPVPQLPCPLPWNVRRAASMDAAIASTAAGVAALDRLSEADPQGEQNGREKHRSGATGHLSNPSTERPTPSGAPRSFFSRHCRARSSVLPL